MPKVIGVYKDGRGRYYFKASIGFDPATGTYGQVTWRGFASAAEAAEARAAFLDGQTDPPPLAVASLSVAEFVGRYLDEREAANLLGPRPCSTIATISRTTYDPGSGTFRSVMSTPR